MGECHQSIKLVKGMQHLSFKYLSQQIYTQEVILNTNGVDLLYIVLHVHSS